MYSKKNIYLTIFFLSLTLWSNNEKFEYPLLNKKKQEIKILTYQELQSLKSSYSPQIVYYYDWEQYQENKKILTRGILFTYRNLIAKEISIAGNFTNWKLIPMKRNTYGVFYYIYKLQANNELNLKKFSYKFLIDGVWDIDPANTIKEIFSNTEVSIFEFEDTILQYHLAKTEILKRYSSKSLQKNDYFLVEFKIHESHLKRILNKEKINSVSIVSNFNYWNPYSNFLEKDEKGIYRWKTKLFKGTYFYNFVIDGEWVLDPLNENTKYLSNFGKTFSYITLE